MYKLTKEEFIEKYGYQSARGYGSALFDVREKLKDDLEKVIEAEKPKWIPVEVRLPEPGKYARYLVASWYAPDDIITEGQYTILLAGIFTATDARGKEIFIWCEDYVGDSSPIWNVTHWMPLPEQPPKLKSDG